MKPRPSAQSIDGTIKVVDAKLEAESVVDGALKLSTVAASIYLTKMILDKVPLLKFVEWVREHKSTLELGIAGLAPGIAIPLELVTGLTPNPSDIFKEVQEEAKNIVSFFLRVPSDIVRKITGDNQATIEQLKAKINSLNLQIWARQNQMDQDAAFQSQTASLLVEVAALKIQVAALEDANDTDKIAAEVDAKMLEAEQRLKWKTAIIIGTLTAATMIYAGDSLIDMVTGLLESVKMPIPLAV